MNLLFRLFFLTVIVGLTACVTSTGNATSEGYQKLCERFRGTPEQAILDYWGTPDKIRKGPNGKTLRYNSITKTVVSGSITYAPQQTYHRGTISDPDYGNATYSGTSTASVPIRQPDWTKTTFCLTSFFIDNTGHVADYRFEGPDCVSSYGLETAINPIHERFPFNHPETFIQGRTE
jgi:hypothetical protein